MAGLTFKNVSKIYDGGVTAVSHFDLTVPDKEFLILVGPSGCGKSTLLRMIAGLEDISEGELYMGDRLMNKIHPKDRDIAMVFQNYALYPHKTVYDNMAFGLKLRRMPSMRIEERILDAAQILDLSELLERKPRALSGGQRQRVALGRSMVRKPKVFLLDEPLSNLDAKLRVAMRTEITNLYRRIGTTFVYVTHDQVEAMTMGTMIAVMRDGVMQQCGTPQQLYENPVNRFVAQFIGQPPMNVFEATLTEKNGALVVRSLGLEIVLSDRMRERVTLRPDERERPLWMGVRPAEDLHVRREGDAYVLRARVDVSENLGHEKMLYLDLEGFPGAEVVMHADKDTEIRTDDRIEVGIDPEHIYLFDKETEQTILKRS